MYTHRVQTCFKVIFSIVDENIKVVFLNLSSSDEFQLRSKVYIIMVCIAFISDITCVL